MGIVPDSEPFATVAGGLVCFEDEGKVQHQPGQREWARDEDGDGVREVHSNSMEGFWTGLRNFLRLFRGVNKEHLSHYVAVHEWVCNLKRVTADFLRAMMWRFTYQST